MSDEKLLLTPDEIEKFIKDYCGACRDCASNTSIYPKPRCFMNTLLEEQLAKAKPIIVRNILDDILSKLRQMERKHAEDKEAQEWIGSLFDIVRQVGKEYEFVSAKDTIMAELKPIIEKQVRCEVGGELCCLIGNKMLEDKEAGKLLASQLEDYLNRALKGEK